MKILCCGDSHTDIFNYCNHKQKDFIFDVCIVGGATAQGSVNPNSKTDALNIFEQKINSTRSDKILIMLGEVDCGFVIWVRSKRYNINVDDQINLSVNNLFTFIDNILAKKIYTNKDIIICGSILPTIRDSTDKNLLGGARSEVNVSQLERTKKTIEYNNLLKEKCDNNGYIYIDITNNIIGKDNMVKDEFLNSNTTDHHLDNEKTYKIWLSKLCILKLKHKIYFVTYGNSMYENSKNRLYNESTNCGWFDSINIMGPENLSESFKTEFKDILEKPRGAGYWIWKFDIIKQLLLRMTTNDILCYVDSGCSINTNGKSRFNEYIEMLNNSNESIISFQLPRHEKSYTIKELFCHLNIDNNTGQFVGGILIMKNNEKTMKIIDDCISVLRADHLLVTDYYNIGQCKEFIENRHDQSILSLVRKKHGSIVLSDETWFEPFGNNKSLNYPFWATRKR